MLVFECHEMILILGICDDAKISNVLNSLKVLRDVLIRKDIKVSKLLGKGTVVVILLMGKKRYLVT